MGNLSLISPAHASDVPSGCRYTARMYEKHIWICAFMLCGTAHQCKIGEVEKDHREEVREPVVSCPCSDAKSLGCITQNSVLVGLETDPWS